MTRWDSGPSAYVCESATGGEKSTVLSRGGDFVGARERDGAQGHLCRLTALSLFLGSMRDNQRPAPAEITWLSPVKAALQNPAGKKGSHRNYCDVSTL